MKNHYHTVYLVFLLLISCSERKYISEELIFEEVEIHIDYPYLPYYYNVSLLEKGEDLFLGGYNHKIHSFDFIHMSNLEFDSNFSIELQKEGPDQVTSVIPFCFTEENIILNDVQSLKVFSFDGKLIKKIGIDSLFSSLNLNGFSRKPVGVNPGGFITMGYSKFTGNLILPIIPIVDTIKELSACPIGVEINLNNNKSRLMLLRYPEEIDHNFRSYYGLIFPSIKDYKDRIVYNYPYSSHIYVYFKEKKQTEIIDLKSKNINDKAAPFNSELGPKEKFEYEYKVQRFRDVNYSPTLGKYFRIHHSQKETIQSTSKSYLMMYDEKSKSQKEFALPDNVSQQYFMTDDFLYFVCEEVVDENKMRLLKIELSTIH